MVHKVAMEFSNSLSLNLADLMKMEISVKTGATVNRSHADKAHLSSLCQTRQRQQRPIANIQRKAENAEDGVNSLETEEWKAVFMIGTKTKYKISVTPKNGNNPRHALTHDGKLEGAKLEDIQKILSFKLTRSP